MGCYPTGVSGLNFYLFINAVLSISYVMFYVRYKAYKH